MFAFYLCAWNPIGRRLFHWRYSDHAGGRIGCSPSAVSAVRAWVGDMRYDVRSHSVSDGHEVYG